MWRLDGKFVSGDVTATRSIGLSLPSSTLALSLGDKRDRILSIARQAEMICQLLGASRTRRVRAFPRKRRTCWYGHRLPTKFDQTDVRTFRRFESDIRAVMRGW